MVVKVKSEVAARHFDVIFPQVVRLLQLAQVPDFRIQVDVYKRQLLNIEMKDFIHDGSEVNRPNNALDIYLKELGSESPKLVYLISKPLTW